MVDDCKLLAEGDKNLDWLEAEISRLQAAVDKLQAQRRDLLRVRNKFAAQLGVAPRRKAP